MKRFRLLRVETARLLQSPSAWLLAGLTALSPLAGYRFFRPALGDSMASLYLANPMVAGGLAGALLFALLTLLSLDRPQRNGTAALTDAMVAPMALHAVRLGAVLLTALLTAAATALLYLPYTAWKLDIVFSSGDYWAAAALFLLSGPVMGALAAAALYQLTYRLDVSLVGVTAALLLSRTVRGGAFLWQWSVPLVPALSDAFGSAVVWRTALYSRVVWLCLLGGGWLLSLLCVRQYGKGLPGSLVRHCRRAALPALSLLLLAAGGWLWQAQPFLDHSPADWMSYEEPYREYSGTLFVERTELRAHVDSYALGTLSGAAVFHLRNTAGAPQDVYLELNSGYTVRSVTANGADIPWEDLQTDYIATRELRCTVPADRTVELKVTYGGMPKLWNAQEDQLSGSYLSAQGLALSSAHLAPTLSNSVLVDEDAPVSLEIRLRDDLTPVSTGSTERIRQNGDGTSDWRLEDAGTDRFRLFAGDYVRVDLEGGGMPIEFYYSRKYQPRLEGMGAVDIMERTIAYCTGHYGPRSFTRDKPFKILQMTVFEFGGFASGNISGMGEVYFSDRNLSDPDKGSASAEVLAHEIIHQWWGLGASLADPDDPDWTDEGITTYTTYRLMREIMGADYAQENYVNKWAETIADNNDSFYLRHPEYLDRLPERYRGQISAACTGVNLYDGSAMLIYRAAQRLGEDRLDEIWSELYKNGGAELPPYITLGDFLDVCGLQEGEIARG